MTKSILIVEDEVVVARGIEQSLVHHGYGVSGVAKNYLQAKKMLLTMATPDLILCDINLNEEKTGIDIVEDITKKARIPVIYISAYSDDKTLAKAFESKPINYLTKPYTENQLLTAVKFALKDSNENQSDKLSMITNREREIIKLLADGMTTREIAECKNRSYDTINNHKRNIFKKLNIHKLSELIAFAVENGLN